MQAKITLIPYGGLCNRMNAILSALAFVEEYRDKYPVHVYWEKSKECYADFDELFKPIVYENITFSKLRKFYLQSNRKNLSIPYHMRKLFFDKTLDGNDIRDADFEKAMGG